MHLELLTTTTTAAGTGGAAAAAATGDSLTIKNSKGPATLLAVWTHFQADGYLQIVKPSGHDTTRGFRAVIDSGTITNLLPAGIGLELMPQELLQVTHAGSGTAGDVDLAHFLIQYDDLPGVSSRLIKWAQLQSRADFKKLVTVQATLTGAAAGYTGTELLTAESDLLQANQDYAVLGITTNVACGSVWIQGPDTGYQRIAAPGNVEEQETGRDWFCQLARAFDMPLIPVINSGNKASTNIGFTQNENNVNPSVSLTLALLK